MELSKIKGIGPKTLELLNMDGIYSVSDLLVRFPKKYTLYEKTNESIFESQNYILVEALIDTKATIVSFRRNVKTVIFYAYINNIKVKCITFSTDYLRYKIFKGTKCLLYGKYKKDIKAFSFQNIFFEDFDCKIEVEYNLKNATDSIIKRAVKSVLTNTYKLEEKLPIELLEKYKLYPMEKYVAASHFPLTKNDYIQVLRRRKYEEFFWYSISLSLLREKNRCTLKTPRIIDDDSLESFLKSLPYELTNDQKKAVFDVKLDMQSVFPMNRLIQGDVGCGKSIVAIIATLLACKASYQVAVMVPTEILANQQFNDFKKMLLPYGITVELLTSSVKKKDKEDILYRLAHGRINVIIGTHALIEENVIFNNLGLSIIDEQHKFGVLQRQKLITKFKFCDSLYLTATPIPRTLGLSQFGDLDITSIESMPNGRKSIITNVINTADIDSLIPIINEHLSRNEQIYVVVPMVLENPDYDLYNINSAYEYFKSKLNTTIGIAHGKQKAQDRTQIMSDFKSGKYKILISTTVIEVGVNVTNAQAMIILNAERFGLSQIHQLRGRVGRSSAQGYCYLVSKDEYSPRLKVLESVSNGFDISVEDFKLRGPGDYLGDAQSGHVALDYADFQLDYKIWQCAYADSKEYIKLFLNKKVKSVKFDEILNEYENTNSKAH
jgi:ATP-dependent DNA helicase RecG